MTAGRKLKISLSLDAALLGLIDRRAANEKMTRSAIVERWLRGAARLADLQRLEEDTAAYYQALTPTEKAEDADWAGAASRSARKLRIDDPDRAGERRRKRG